MYVSRILLRTAILDTFPINDNKTNNNNDNSRNVGNLVSPVTNLESQSITYLLTCLLISVLDRVKRDP